MADYDLGTAHGRIVVDYDDKGVDKAEKSFDKLKGKTKELLGQFSAFTAKWKAQAKSLGDNAEGLQQKFQKAGAGAAYLGTALAVLNKDIIGAGSGVKIIKGMGEAFGHLPDGAEKFPSLIKRIIQVSAAVTLFHGATGLLARATRNIAGVSFLTRNLAGLGGILNGLASPLRFVASGFLGFLTVMKGFEAVKKYAKYLTLFDAGFATLGAGIKVIAGVAESVKELSGALLLLPAAAGIAGLAMLTLKIGTSGVGDAMKAVAKGDAKALAKAMKDLAPAAQEFVRAYQEVYKQFKVIKVDVQQHLFEGLGAVLKDLAGLYLPLLQNRLDKVATSFNQTGKGIAAFFNDVEVANDFGEGLDYSATALDNLLKAVPPLTQAFYMLWRVGVEVFADITSGAGAAAQRFADFIKEARSSGNLKKWMQGGVQAVKDLYNALKNIVQISAIVFKGLGVGRGQESFLKWLKDATQGVEDFLNSAKGQELLKTFGSIIENASKHVGELADAFMKYVLPAIQAFLPYAQQLSDAVINGLILGMKILSPLFVILGQVLSALGPALGPIVTAMVAMGVVFAGLALGAKLAGTAMLIFRTAALGLKAIEGVGSILSRFGGGVGLAGKAIGGLSKLLKGGAIAAGLFLVADGLNEVNLKAVGGDPTKLDQMSKTLYNLVEAGKMILSGDLPGIISQVTDQVNKTGDVWSKNEAPVQKWFDKVKTSFETDFVGALRKGSDSMDTFFAGIRDKVGNSFQKDFVDPIKRGLDNVGQFFTDLPGKIGGAVGTIGSVIGTIASNIWQGFLTFVTTTFQPVIDFFSKTPYEMGFAIGSGIGELLKAGGDLINSLLLGAQTAWAGFMIWLSTLLPSIGTALADFGTFLWTLATDAWTQFTNAFTTKKDEVVAGAQALPGQIGDGLSSLAATLSEKATTAWNEFNAWQKQKIDEAIAYIQTLPGRAGAELTSLKDFLVQKATDAWNGFIEGCKRYIENALAEVRAVPGKISAAIGNLGNLLVGAGEAVINGLLTGIKRAVQAMYDFVSGIAAGIAARKGPLPYDKKLLIPAGIAIIGGLVNGMKQSIPLLWKTINGVNSDLAGIGGASAAVNLRGVASTSGVTSGLTTPVISPSRVRGGDGASSGESFTIGQVVIPAKDIKEFKDVTDFFSSVQQKARAGKGTR